MLEINGKPFLGAATELRAITIFLAGVPDQTADIATNDRAFLLGHVERMTGAIETIGARSALASATRLRESLKDATAKVTYHDTVKALTDIESRFADHLDDIKIFMIGSDQAVLFSGADVLLGQPCADRYKAAWFDCEEAAKCLVLGRPTATVFHCMRMLEIALRSLAKRLGIADPTKPAQRNWGVMLGAIKKALDTNFPPSTRTKGSEALLLEKIYASLDAVKNPWRNATMHVEDVYTEAEARHILQCTAALIQLMATGFDEDGADVPLDPLVPSAP